MTDDADGAFAALAGATLDGILERWPERATEEGDHRHDDRLTVGTAAHYAEAIRWAGERLAGLDAIDAGRLSPQNRVDAQILGNELARLRFGMDVLREYQWNPMIANPGRAVYLLLARDFAPLPDRLRSVAHRLDGVPESLAASRAVLAAMPQVHIETALNQFAGTRRLITDELGRLVQDADGPRELSRAVPPALEAIDEHARWLEQRLADGKRDGFRDPRIGADMFTTKLRLVLDTELTADEVLARAETDLVRVSEEIASVAAGLGAAGA